MSEDADFVIHLPRNQRVCDILNAFIGSKASVCRVKDTGLRLTGGRPSPLILDKAARSGGKPPKGPIGRALKREFLVLQYRGSKSLLERYPSAGLVVWNGIKGRRSLLAYAAELLEREVFYFEEAPFPKRIAIDRCGVNYGNSLPRDTDFYRAWLAASETDPDYWRDVGKQIAPRLAEEREDVQSEEAPPELAQERFIFCPLQVPGDSQITIYGDWIGSVEDTIDRLKTASSNLPEGWHLRIKEHPSSQVSFFEKLDALRSDKFRIDNITNTMEQVALSCAVLSVNSSVGLQAFFSNKPVIVLGHAFYGFGTLATKVSGPSELSDILKRPENLTFCQESRTAFMSYLCEEYYPMEQDVLDGCYGPENVRQRDRERDNIIAML